MSDEYPSHNNPYEEWDPDDDSLEAQVSRAKKVLSPYRWPNRYILRSSLFEWFPRCSYNQEFEQEISNALLVNLIDDFEYLDEPRARESYTRLGDSAASFAGQQPVSPEEYLKILEVDPEEIEEITRCWLHLLQKAKDPSHPDAQRDLHSLALKTVERLMDFGLLQASMSSTDMFYLLARPYAEALLSGQGITIANLSRALRFERHIDEFGDEEQNGPELPWAFLYARAKINFIQHQPAVYASQVSMDRLANLPISPQGLADFIDHLFPKGEYDEVDSREARWLKLRLDPSYPGNLSKFFAVEELFDEKLEEFCWGMTLRLSEDELVIQTLNEWMAGRYRNGQ